MKDVGVTWRSMSPLHYCERVILEKGKEVC